MFDFDVMTLLLGLPALVLAIVGHEYAHAQAAHCLGDDTAERYGRLTLNPLVHFDIIGTLALFIAGIGWAKPVPVNVANFKDPKKDEILVAFAGPAANLIMAFVAFVIYSLADAMDFNLSRTAYQVLSLIVLYNINFAIFNMLPIPPLDGSTIITAFMPWEWRLKFRSFQILSFIMFLVIVNTPILGLIFRPLAQTILHAFQGIVNIFL